MLINIYSKGKYPANVLSNFAANEFDFAGYKQIPSLIDSGRKLFFHTIGKTMRKNTVLTWWEFVGVLYKMRKEVRLNG